MLRLLLGTRRGIALTAILSCIFAGWLGVRVAYPRELAQRWQAANDRLEQRVSALRRKNEGIQERVRWLNTPRGIEERGRQLGMVMQGQSRLRVPGN